MIAYTRSQVKVKTQQDYDTWIKSLKPGDNCLVQEFIPKGNSCLDSKIECWRFWQAKFYNDTVEYNFEKVPLRPDGVLTYWNSDAAWGNVFPARIVPLHLDLLSPLDNYLDCHAPVFEPAWKFKVVFLDEYERFHKFNNAYRYDVESGNLVIAFGDSKEIINIAPSTFKHLYSEYLLN